jgi:hypothetical protein
VTSSLTRGGAVIYNCWWSSPAQSFSGPKQAGLMNIFYCQRYQTPPTWGPSSRSYVTQEQGGLVMLSGTAFSFRRLLRLARLRWRFSNSPQRGSIFSYNQSYITIDGVGHSSGTRDQMFLLLFLIILDSYGFVDVGRPL